MDVSVLPDSLGLLKAAHHITGLLIGNLIQVKFPKENALHKEGAFGEVEIFKELFHYRQEDCRFG